MLFYVEDECPERPYITRMATIDVTFDFVCDCPDFLSVNELHDSLPTRHGQTI